MGKQLATTLLIALITAVPLSLPVATIATPATVYADSASFTDSSWAGYDEYDSNSSVITNANDNLMIDLGTHASADFWSNVASDGSDIRITNAAGDTAYSFELENFDATAQTGILFFNSQGLSTSATTTYRVYSGNSGASMPAPSDTLGAQNVWNSNYKLRWSMEGSTSVTDSTSNNNDGTISGTAEVDGQIGKAQDHEEDNNDYVAASDDASLDLGTGSVTLSAWVNLESTGSFGGILSKEDGSDNSGYRISKRNSDIVEVWFEGDDARSNSTLSAGTWAWVVGRRDGTNVEIFFNGSSEVSNTDNSVNTDNNADIATGPYRPSDKTSNMFDGDIDEARVYAGALSDAYITTEYNNQNDNATFWTNNGWTAVTGEEPEPAPQQGIIWFGWLYDEVYDLV